MSDELLIRWAEPRDVAAVVRIINLAFRAAESFFVEGDRITAEILRPLLEKGHFLLAEDAAGLVGCVYLQLQGERAYFGLLAVDPAQQHRGVGRRLIVEVENHARAAGCHAMDIRVVSLREELPPFYRRRGYVETGTAPFPEKIKSILPCHFVLMSKPLGQPGATRHASRESVAASVKSSVTFWIRTKQFARCQRPH
jgi:N-acetylglutamate synthase-like GNAT family acetyltransferase